MSSPNPTPPNGQTQPSVDESTIWLMESSGDDIAVAYVQQGNKVFVAKGRDKATSLPESVQIVESITDLEHVQTLVESAGKQVPRTAIKDGKWVVEGVFQRSDTENINKRKYSRKLWERVLAESAPAQKSIGERRMIGHVEHPEDGRTDLKKSAILVTSNKLREDGVVWGTAEVLNTPDGLVLQALCEAGIPWGVSSRGRGRVDANGQVDESKYTLVTYDAVDSPSTPGARPPARKVVEGADGVVESAGNGAPPARVDPFRELHALAELDEAAQMADVVSFVKKMAHTAGRADVASTMDTLFRSATKVQARLDGVTESTAAAEAAQTALANALDIADTLRASNLELVAQLAESRKNPPPSTPAVDTAKALDDLLEAKEKLQTATDENTRVKRELETVREEAKAALTTTQARLAESEKARSNLSTQMLAERDQLAAFLVAQMPGLKQAPAGGSVKEVLESAAAHVKANPKPSAPAKRLPFGGIVESGDLPAARAEAREVPPELEATVKAIKQMAGASN